MSRPRPRGLLQARSFVFGAVGMTLMLVSQLLLVSRSGPPDRWHMVFIAFLLVFAAVNWGLTIGGLLQAYWPAQPDTPPDQEYPEVRPPLVKRTARFLNGVPLFVLLVPSVVIAGLALYGAFAPRPYVQGAQVDSALAPGMFLAEAGLAGMQMLTCRDVPGFPAVETNRALCLSSPTDGLVQRDVLRFVLRQLHGELVGVSELPALRQGNLMTGKVRAQISRYGQGPVPVQLEYRGLLYTHRTASLSPEEKWLDAQPFSSYVIVRGDP